MKYPEFFDTVETIVLQDELSDFLGVFEDGIMEVSYLDVVKSAGHSCPTIAGAYLMTLKGLQALYGKEIPQRGGIRVEFGESEEAEVTGVIANVVENITGATAVRGFKGIGGRFVRHSLMMFNAPVDSSLRLTRVDNSLSSDVYYSPGKIPGDTRIPQLISALLQGSASKKDKELLGNLWQERVKALFDRAEEVITIRLHQG